MQKTGNEPGAADVVMATSKINIVNTAGKTKMFEELDIEDKIPTPYDATGNPDSFITIVESISDSTIDSTGCVNETGFSGAPTVIKESYDKESLLDHAGWAVKRAMDVINSGPNELPARGTVAEDSEVLLANKPNALEIISPLGDDVKQADGRYRFFVHTKHSRSSFSFTLRSKTF